MGRPGSKSRSTQQETQYNYSLTGSSQRRTQRTVTSSESPQPRSRGYEAVIRCRQRKELERKMKEDELAKLREENENLRKECEEIEKMYKNRQLCTCSSDFPPYRMHQHHVNHENYDLNFNFKHNFNIN